MLNRDVGRLLINYINPFTLLIHKLQIDNYGQILMVNFHLNQEQFVILINLAVSYGEKRLKEKAPCLNSLMYVWILNIFENLLLIKANRNSFGGGKIWTNDLCVLRPAYDRSCKQIQ